MKYTQCPAILFAIAIPFAANAADKPPSLQSEWGNPNTPMVIDVSIEHEVSINKPNDMGKKLYIKLVNLPPKQRSQFRHHVQYEESEITGLISPSQMSSAPNTEPVLIASNDREKLVIKLDEFQKPACLKTLDALEKKLFEDATTRKQVPGLMLEVESVSTAGIDICETKKTFLKNVTTAQLEPIAVESGEHLIFTLAFAEGDSKTEIAKVTLKEKVKEWVMHTGWTFIKSKDRSYFSSPNDDNTFSVALQGNQRSINHALTAMYTYPMGNFFNDTLEAGPTGLLGLSQNGLLVGFGGSLIFKKNIILNFGIVVTEFDKLNGVYSVGQNIGDNAIDSSALTNEKILPSIAVTLGFRFK